MALLHVLVDGVVLLLVGAEDPVAVVASDHGSVGGDHHDAQLVDLVEFLRFGVGGSRHPRELPVHPEVVLEGDGGQSLVLAGDAHAFLGFHGLVQPVRPAPSRHGAARELVDDHDLAVLDHVVGVALVDHVRAQRLLDVVDPIGVGVRVEVVQPERLLAGLDAAVGQERVLVLLLHLVVDVLLQQRDDRVGLSVLVGALLGRPGDDERGARLVDQDGIDLVHDGEIQLALHAFVGLVGHVVAQVVEAELVVRAVGDVGVVGLAPLRLALVVDDEADGQSQEPVEPTHPLGVATGQVVVDRDHVHALAFQGVEVDGGGGHQGLALAGLHLGDLACVEDHPAAHLHVEDAHAVGGEGIRVQFAHPGVEVGRETEGDDVGALLQGSPGLVHELLVVRGKQGQVESELGIQDVEDAQATVSRLACHRERFGQEIVERGPLRHPAAEFQGLRGELVVVQGGKSGLQGESGLHRGGQLLVVPFVGSAKELGEDRFDQHGVSKQGSNRGMYLNQRESRACARVPTCQNRGKWDDCLI